MPGFPSECPISSAVATGALTKSRSAGRNSKMLMQTRFLTKALQAITTIVIPGTLVVWFFVALFSLDFISMLTCILVILLYRCAQS